MSIWEWLTSNYIINVGVVAWFSAQCLKTLITLIRTKKLNMERMVGAGGWPSSHSALTVSIAIAMANKLGYASPEFGLALAFAAIVMYDAMGVRRAAGEQAKVLNKMIFDFPDFPWFEKRDKYIKSKDILVNEDHPGEIDEKQEEGQKPESTPIVEKELKEFLGHTPFEVLGGCLLGILVAMFMPVV
ncbi:MAG: divergent PAP2 family protein [Oscillospiraceae bacterium]